MAKYPRYFVISDIDGCVSDDRWRRHLLPRPGPSGTCAQGAYDEYHAQASEDAPVSAVLRELMNLTYQEGEVVARIVFVTARPEKMRETTMRWLRDKCVSVSSRIDLLMRPEGNCDKSPVMKMMLLNDYFNGTCDGAANGWARVVGAFDDRADVLRVYPVENSIKFLRVLADSIPAQITAAQVLSEAAKTFAERNAVYKDNYLCVAPVIKALWPRGVPPDLVTEDRWHLFELMVVKMSRFAISGLSHIDSVHDMAVYAAMIESDIRRRSV